MEQKTDLAQEKKYAFLDEVCRITGYKKRTIYTMKAQGRFPKPIPSDGRRKLMFLRQDIFDWIENGRKHAI